MVKQLIITADDFGAAKEVNEAVEQAHRGGILTAASLMVSAPAAADAVVRAKTMPNLRVGLHLTLVDDRPTLPSAIYPETGSSPRRTSTSTTASGTRSARNR